MTQEPEKKDRKKDRLKIQLQKMAEQDSKERIKNVGEVPLGYTVEQAVTEAKRCIECKTKPCIDGCPVGIARPNPCQATTCDCL